MPKPALILSLLPFLLLIGGPAHADFVISSAILEFTADGPGQQDIELVSHSESNDYVIAEINEIIHPGLPDEKRRIVDDPSEGRLLVTPDKTILASGSRKVMRFVLLKDPDQQEHVYRVVVKPVIKGLDAANAKVGLKVLVGYEVLVIIRPVAPHPLWNIERHGKKLTVANTGNTNILLQNGQQCDAPQNCKNAPVVRAYAGETATIDLPEDKPVNYSVWDGSETTMRSF